MKYGLPQEAIDKICAVFARFREIDRAVLYGSRAKGNFKQGSDIDLTLYGEALTPDVRSAIASALDDLPLAYTIDLSVFDELDHVKLRDHIERVGVMFYERANPESGLKKDWRKRKLGDVLQIQNGCAFDSKRFNATSGMPLIRIRDLKNGRETETRYDGDYEERYVVRAGDLLIGMDGEFGCYEWAGPPALLNQRVCRLQDFDREVMPRFVRYGVNSYLKDIEDVTAYATVKHLSSKQILEIDFPTPPLPEQQRIVGILDAAFDGIAKAKANTEANLKNARAVFEGALHESFANGEDWRAVPFEESIEDVEYTRKIQRNQFLDEGTLPIISQEADFINGYWNEEADAFRVNRPVVLFGDHTQVVKFVDFDFVLGADGVKILQPKSFLVPRFFFHQVRNAKLESLGYARHYRLLKELTIRYPSTDKQATITRRLDGLETETKRLEAAYIRKLAALESLKKSFLHQAFTGSL